MEGQTKRSKCVCHPSNGHEGSSPPGRGSTLDSHGQGWPCGEWACKQATRDPYVPRLPPLPPAPVFYLYFIFLPLLSLSPRGRDVVKFPTTRICWRGREGGREGHENSSISYWKVCCGPRIRDLVIYIHGMERGFPYSPLHLYFLYSALEADIPDNFVSISKDI